MKENSLYEKKSLKEITGKTADWNEVAKDCVAFSNAQGGIIDYGIEDDGDEQDDLFGSAISWNSVATWKNRQLSSFAMYQV